MRRYGRYKIVDTRRIRVREGVGIVKRRDWTTMRSVMVDWSICSVVSVVVDRGLNNE
jgi:hypothetical protein